MVAGSKRRSEQWTRVRALLFPDRLSWLLIWVTVGLLVILTVTGVLLTFWYVPDTTSVVYDGAYSPLRGLTVSEAFASVLAISFEIGGGLLVRQAHHWSTLLLNAVLVIYLARLFFGGLYRRPRRPLWLAAIGMVLLGLAAGFTGYVLPDDLLSGATLWIASGVLLSIPVLGPRLNDLAFGGEFPGDFIEGMYWLHILAVPVAIAGLIGLVIWWARRTDTRASGTDEATVEHPQVAGPPGRQRIRVAGVLFVCAGVVALMAGLMQITPVGLYGPSDPASAGSGAQPDWYLGFVDGALRLFPNWEVSLFGGTLVLAVLIPGIVFPGLLFTTLALVPLIESRLVAEPGPAFPARLREAPRRTALGVAGLVFYATLLASGGVDIIATEFHIAFETLLRFFQITVIAGPVIAFQVTRRICVGLANSGLDPADGTVYLTPGGEYTGHAHTTPESLASKESPGDAEILAHEDGGPPR